MAIGLALAIGWQLVALLDRALNPNSQDAQPWAAPGAARQAERQADREALIRSAALFGRASSPAATEPSTLGWQLVGVIAESDPRRGRAILGASPASANVYAVGDALPGGRRLHAVEADRVLIDRSGVLEVLELPRLTAADRREPPRNVELSGTGGQWGDLLRWQTVSRDDRSVGLRVYPGNNASVFARLGLTPGDLLVAINGVPLADAANAEQFLRTLTGAPRAAVTVERGGRTETLTIDLTSLELTGFN